MIFVVSDIHLGKKPETDRQSLHELQECISALNPTDVVFLGDTFDAFVEHPRYLPKQVVEWSEMVFLMQRNGINVHFVAGNHDRWHRGHIARLIGSEVRREAFTLSWSDRTIHLEHGDGIELLDTFTPFCTIHLRSPAFPSIIYACSPFRPRTTTSLLGIQKIRFVRDKLRDCHNPAETRCFHYPFWQCGHRLDGALPPSDADDS